MVTILLYIPFFWLHWKAKSQLTLEYIYISILFSFCQLVSPIYEEDFKNGMIDVVILKKYRNGFLFLVNLIFVFLIGDFSMFVAPNFSMIDIVKLSTIIMIEGFILTFLAIFFN